MIRKLSFTLLLVALFTSCAPNPTEVPTLTPVGSVSAALETMDKYFMLINTAETKDDLTEPWNMWTLEAQCNPREQCSLFRFQDMRWPNKVLYKLYDCGSDRVIAEEMPYPRDADESAVGDTEYWRYQLGEFDEVMMISDVRKSQPPGEDCVLIEKQ